MFKRYLDRRAAVIKDRLWAQIAHDLHSGETPVECIRIDASDSGVAIWGFMFVTNQRIINTLEFSDRSQRVFNFIDLDRIDQIIQHEKRGIALTFINDDGEQDARIAFVARIVPSPMIGLFLTALREAHASAREQASETS